MKYFLFFCLAFIGNGAIAQQKTPASLPIQYDTIYTKPTVQASYPGGDSAWKKYVQRNLKYPRTAIRQNLETEVVVKVIINEDGSIASAQHLTNSGYGFEKEAERLVLQSGRWNPAFHRGIAVKSEGQLVVQFRLR